MSILEAQSIADLRAAPNATKSTRAWQECLWALWTTPAQWPGVMDVYEAAAYRRVSHTTIRGALVPDRQGRARLRHQRFGAAYRINKTDLDAFGVVEGRA